MTYSIIAKDPATGQMGVAVQTCNLAVGAWVPWGAGGIGVIATQAMAERSYGAHGLELMRTGMPAPKVLQVLLAADPGREVRQVSMLDSSGEVATHTGECCIPAAGAYAGDGYCVQANMVASESVWQAMVEAFPSARGDLADRLMAALHAAEAAGGDLRGRQSAALLIFDSLPSSIPLIDLRIDYAADPVGELDRMLQLHRAHARYYQILDLVEQGDLARINDLTQEISELASGEPYLQYLRAVILDRHLSQRDEALVILRELVNRSPVWFEYLKREMQTGGRSQCQGVDASLVAALEASMFRSPQEFGKQEL